MVVVLVITFLVGVAGADTFLVGILNTCERYSLTEEPENEHSMGIQCIGENSYCIDEHVISTKMYSLFSVESDFGFLLLDFRGFDTAVACMCTRNAFRSNFFFSIEVLN